MIDFVGQTASRLVIYSGVFYHDPMGLLYTKFYMDFDAEDWTQISNDPIVFQALKKNVILEIEDTSHKSYKLNFKQGGKINMFRVTGKFRLTWNDDDLFDSKNNNGNL